MVGKHRTNGSMYHSHRRRQHVPAPNMRSKHMVMGLLVAMGGTGFVASLAGVGG